jgi:hypothetical protein
MQPVIGLNCSLPGEYATLSPTTLIWQDVLAQAMTGELMAAMNYTSLSEICDDPAEVADALEHAAGEKGHAAAFAAEEEEHIEHAMEILQAERALDPQSFDGKLYQLHLEVMTTLAEMLARDCRTGHCEVCHGGCVKPALPDVSLSAAELRGASLHQYLKTLDKLGLPGEVTLAWVAQLPV